MVTKPSADELPSNRLLALLTPRDYASLRPHLERLPLEYRKSLYQAVVLEVMSRDCKVHGP